MPIYIFHDKHKAKKICEVTILVFHTSVNKIVALFVLIIFYAVSVIVLVLTFVSG